jgi:hypothetical protein
MEAVYGCPRQGQSGGMGCGQWHATYAASAFGDKQLTNNDGTLYFLSIFIIGIREFDRFMPVFWYGLATRRKNLPAVIVGYRCSSTTTETGNGTDL